MQDNLLVNSHWVFNEDVTTIFDDMLARSIPQYDVMRKAVYDLGQRYITPSCTVIDLGCSRGEALAPFVEDRQAGHYIGIEMSPPMYTAARERFRDNESVAVRCEDLRTYYPPEDAQLTLCILTLQFTPIEYRQRILRNIYRHTLPGGAFILVEKVLGATAELDMDMTSLYYALKDENGYTTEQVERKRLSLEGVLVPVTARWNEELLQMAGFSQVDCFWRWCNFAGWIAVK